MQQCAQKKEQTQTVNQGKNIGRGMEERDKKEGRTVQEQEKCEDEGTKEEEER